MVPCLRWFTAPRLATQLLPLAAVMAAPFPAPGQQAIVEQESQRRLSLEQEALNLAAEADTALADGRTADAVSRYRAALDRISPGATAQAANRQSIIARFADSSVTYARELAESGEIPKARLTLEAVLEPDIAPAFSPARTLLDQLEDPDDFNPAQTAGHFAATKKIRDLFVLARGQEDIADYKAARMAYNQILAVDNTNTAARRGLERTERAVNNYLRAARDQTRASMINEVDRQWETAITARPFAPSDTLEAGSVLSGGNGTSAARRKMETLIVDRVAMSDTPLAEALTYLARKSIEVDTAEPDPQRKGVNIVFNPAGADPASIRNVTLELRGSSLGDVLRSIADMTGTRLSTLGNTVTVTPLGATTRVISRTFRVPPGLLTRSGTASAGTTATQDPFTSGDAESASGLTITRISAQDWLMQNGVPFPEGTSADYSAGTNQLIVRNTEENLALVQTAVENASDKTQRQIQVQVVLLKAEQKYLQEHGYDWLLDAAQVQSGVFATGGTFGNATVNGAGRGGNYGISAPLTGTTVVPVGYNPVTAGLRSTFDLQTNPTIDDLIASGSAGSSLTGNRSPGIVSVAGVFTSPQFQGILRGLNQKTGIDLSIAQTIILKAGQRATAASLRTIRFPTEFDPPQIPQTVTSPQLVDLTTGIVFSLPSNSIPPVTPTTPQSFEDKDTGSSIEVEATVGEDGTTVDLNLAVVFREFDGFINFGTPITANGQVLTDNLIFQPVISAINESTQVQVYDGATVTIGGLSDAKYETINDKVPLLGDIPFLGRLFRSDITRVTRKAAIYFVTVKVVDPGGLGIQEAAAAAEEAAATSLVR